MAPKTKKEKLTEEKIQDICLEYMNAQNRPYNATDVALNCHEQFSKGAAQKALQGLADRGAIDYKNMAKDGKSTLIFCARQDQEQSLDADGLAKLDEDLLTLKDEVNAVKERNKKLVEQLNIIRVSKSTVALELEEKEIEREIKSAQTRLEAIGSRKLYSESEIAKIDRDYIVMRKLHKRHRKEDVFAALCEGMDKTKKESVAWREELGIDEVDDDPRCRWIEDPLADITKRSKTKQS